MASHVFRREVISRSLKPSPFRFPDGSLKPIEGGASFVYTPALALLSAAALNDLRMLLVMTNTTADTEVDSENPGDVTTLDEFDGNNYSRATLGSEAVNVDLANNRAEIDFADPTFSTIGNGTRQIQGFIVIQNVDGTAGNDLLKFYQDFSATLNPGGASLTVQIDAEGLVQVANA